MNPDPVNGIVGASQAPPRSPSMPPSAQGQIQTSDFQASGNLLMLYRHLKEMYEPPVHSESGPIKTMSNEELEREKHQTQEDFVKSLPPTIGR